MVQLLSFFYTVPDVVAVPQVVSSSPLVLVNKLLQFHPCVLFIMWPLHLVFDYVLVGVSVLCCLISYAILEHRYVLTFLFLIVYNVPVIHTNLLQTRLFVFVFVFLLFLVIIVVVCVPFVQVPLLFLSLAFLRHCFLCHSRILCFDLLNSVGVNVIDVCVGVVEVDEFGDGSGGGGYPNEKMTELEDPIEKYLSGVTWLVQVVSISCDAGGRMIWLLVLVLLVFLEQVVDE